MQDIKVVTFPLFAFNRCKYGAGVFILKALSNQEINIDTKKLEEILLLPNNYMRFSGLNSFTAYAITETTDMKRVILNIENLFKKDVTDVAKYYSNYQIMYEEYILLYDIFKQIILKGLEMIKLSSIVHFNFSVFIDVSDISNLYTTKLIDIMSKIEHFKSSFKSFYFYNEFFLLQYEVFLDEASSKLEIRFKDSFSTSMNINVL